MSTVKLKQMKVIKALEENPRISMGKAMQVAGYSKLTANNPANITRSKSWQELMDERLNDDFLTSKHIQLLNKQTEDGEVDTNAVRSGLDMAYKLKGRYKENVTNVQVNNFVPLLGGQSANAVHENTSDREDPQTP